MLKKNLINLITHWSPANILAKEGKPKKFCLIVLNQPITQIEYFNRLWDNGKNIYIIVFFFSTLTQKKSFF